MSKNILCLLVNGFEELELMGPVDLLRRAGARVVMASLTGEEWVRGRCEVTIKADARLQDLREADFDALLIPGGPGVKAMRADGRAAKLARSFAAAGKPVAAICAGPTVLADAGLLNGKRFTAHFSVTSELPQALPGERVVVDGNIITSRGAGTSIDFGLALVEHLYGGPVAAEIAKAIMV
jgi:4-methyl-5(b-hydroxyethyl)-thiazole monophosphate biosynthesis